MRQVILVSLDNNAFHLDEDAYAALQRYMDRAKAGLRNNPDVGEILGDVERAISVKCAAVLTPTKNVVSGEEMAAILEEVGPVVEESAGQNQETEAPEPKRLYRQPKGAMVEGVCTGLSEYFNTDVVIFRLLFVILAAASGGLGGGLYLIMVMVVPSREPDVPKTKAPRRIHPAIWVTSIALLLFAIVAFVPIFVSGIDSGIPQPPPPDMTPRGGLSFLMVPLMSFAVPMIVIGSLTLLFVLIAKYLSGRRTKE
jgi:phage shock protein PspC (stress-responsive transcriptional regulator)